MKTLLTYPQNQGRFLIVLIPLILSFLLNCTSASESSGPPPLPSDLMFTSSAIMGSPVTFSEANETITVLPCTVLDNVDIAALVNGNPSTDYNVVADLPVYYDRSLLSAAERTGDITSATEIQITDSTSEVLATFSLTVNFSQCQTAHLTGTGDGTAGTPYELSKPEHLELMAHLVNNSNATYGAGHYDLTAPIDLEVAKAPWTEAAGGKGFTPIGTTVSATADNAHTTSFTGTFDCANNIIANLYINNEAAAGTANYGYAEGLFGSIGTGGTITNCRLENVDVTGYERTGGLAGLVDGGTIGNSYVTGEVTSTATVGGLVGVFSNGTISNAYATVKVTEKTGNSDNTGSAGGLAGFLTASYVSNAYATGDVTGIVNVGGLIGQHENVDLTIYTISNAYATGNVTGINNVGGLIGKIYNFRGLARIINNTYASGSVTGTGDNVGGFIGQIDETIVATGDITSSYWEGPADTTLQSVGSDTTSSMTANITRLTATGLKTGTAFTTDWLLSKWNFTGPTTDSDGNPVDGIYPRLINVPCANRQHFTTPPDMCSSTLPATVQ